MDPLFKAIESACQEWRRNRRLADLLPSIFDWILGASGAERVLLVSPVADGGYRIWGSATVDGERVSDPSRSISHFAIMRALDDGGVSFFAETDKDRRFRTEAERETEVRSRSILVIPVVDGEDPALLYLDTRFSKLSPPTATVERYQFLCGILAIAIEGERQKIHRRKLNRDLARSRSKSTEDGLKTPETSVATADYSRGRTVEVCGFFTRSPELIPLLEEVRRVAETMIPVLIEGESGSGKDRLASAIHKASGRTGRCVTLHCGSIPEQLVEVELFGHARGAFTGAEREREGLLDRAQGGTLLLDAIDEAPGILQSALLRVLESGRFRRIAGDEEFVSDVRVLACSHPGAHLPASPGEEAPLREDLFYRLAGLHVSIPPLRERPEDVLLLAEMFLASVLEREVELGPGTQAVLLSHDWPGNAWELVHMAKRIDAAGIEELDGEHLQQVLAIGQPLKQGIESDVQSVIDRTEREVILRALEESAGNKSMACRLLGFSRRTLYRRMEKHGIPL